jgi:FkbM family methyltransferase
VGLVKRVQRFVSYPTDLKLLAVTSRWRRWLPWLPFPLRLRFGAWWLAKNRGLDQYLFEGGFENAEIRFTERYLQRGMTILDVGAHQGLYTLLASKRVGPKGRVISFEPSPRERRWLVRHVRLNFCRNVRVEGSDEDWGNSLRPPAVKGSTRRVRVEVISLDDYLAKNKNRPVDFVKLDVEGAELEVLKGAQRLLTERPRPVILAEVYDVRTEPWGYRAKDIVQHLGQLGYEWFEIGVDGGITRIESDSEVFDANLVAVPKERVGQMKQIVGEP